MLHSMKARNLYSGAIHRLGVGVAIGAANTVPGVSGGTIAVVTGFYDAIVGAIGDLFSVRWRTNLLFLLPVLLGIAVGIGVFAWFIDLGLTHAPEQTAFVFFGLIAGSIPYISRQVRGARPRPYELAVAAVAASLLVVQAVAGRAPLGDAISSVSATTILPLLGAGAIAAATMIIPGVSGSFVLVIIGMYTTFLQAVRTANVPVLVVLLAGAAVGIVLVSKVMSFLLTRYHRATYWAILGLVAGSLVSVWPGVTSLGAAVADIAAATVGAALALLLGGRRGGRDADVSAESVPPTD
jgi:putative membrane protein